MRTLLPGAWGVRCGPWLVASSSATGEHHDICEDAAMAYFPESGGVHVCVADGVSLGEVGHIAAQSLARHCVSLPEDDAQNMQAVGRWVEAADHVVAGAVAACGRRRGAACMASAWLGAGGSGTLSHVGDCRLYRWSLNPNGTANVADLTVDQTFLHLGEAPPLGVGSRNPARMAGSGSVGDAEVRAHHLPEGCGLLLCSDGVHVALTAQDLGLLIGDELRRRNPAGPYALDRVSQAIVHASAQRGSADDICVAIIWRQPITQAATGDSYDKARHQLPA